MAKNNTSELQSLNEIIKDRFFLIPDYQRGYAWDESQLIDIRKDIENLSGRIHMHYTGTIVATLSKTKSDTYEIVDGQQRLTTLIILLKCIYDHDSVKYKTVFEDYIQKGLVGSERLVLTPNKETADLYEDAVIKGQMGIPEIKSHYRIIGAKIFFEKWLKEDGVSVDEILNIVTNKLGFLFFTPGNDKEIGIMFEVINNRGKQLSELEKIKNFFIYYSTIHDREKLRQDINTKWENLQINLSKANVDGNEDENNFLRYCYLVFYSHVKSKSWYVYSELKDKYNVQNNDPEYIDNSVREIQKFIDFIEKASLYYAYLFNKNNFFESNYSEPASKRQLANALKMIRSQHVHASIMPLYLAIMMRQDNPSRVNELLEILEIVNFRIYILPTITARADTYQGDLFWFAHFFYHQPDWESGNPDVPNRETIHNAKEIKGNIFDWVKAQLIELTKSFCPENKIISALTLDLGEGGDFYDWPGLRYFLGNYEKKIQREYGHNWDIEVIAVTREESNETLNDYLSREHIWASRNRTDQFPIDYLEKRRLGNFVLLGLSKNISLSNDDIDEKVTELLDRNNKNSGRYHLYQVEEIEQDFKLAQDYIEKELKRVSRTKMYYENLATKICDVRETRLIEFALERWRLPHEKFNRFDKVDSFNARNNRLTETFILKS